MEFKHQNNVSDEKSRPWNEDKGPVVLCQIENVIGIPLHGRLEGFYDPVFIMFSINTILNSTYGDAFDLSEI